MAGLMEMLGMARQPQMRGMMADTEPARSAFPGMIRGNRMYINGDPKSDTSWMSLDDVYAKRPFDENGEVRPGVMQPAPQPDAEPQRPSNAMANFINSHQMQPSNAGSMASFLNSHQMQPADASRLNSPSMQAEAAPMMGKLATPNADPEAATNPVMARLLRMKQQMQGPAPEPGRMAMSENFRDPRIMQPAMSRLGVANLTAPHWVDMGGGRMVRSDQLGQ